MTKDRRQLDGSLILIVEDNLMVQRNIAFLLQVAGFNVMTAVDGAEALNLMTRHVPDLILADTDVEGMGGFELLANVRNDLRLCHIPVILTSAQYAYDDLMYALDLGANEFLPKPFDAYDLIDAICLALGDRISDHRLAS